MSGALGALAAAHRRPTQFGRLKSYQCSRNVRLYSESASHSNPDMSPRSSADDAVKTALQSAKKAADSAESAMDRVASLPSAQRPHRVRRILKTFALRGALTATVGGALVHLVLYQVSPFLVRFYAADIVTAGITLVGYAKHSLSASGALVAAFVGTSNIMASYAFGGLLLAFFVSSSGLTRFSGSFKKKYDAEHKKGGQRNWVQVLCNGGLPSVLALLYFGDVYITAIQAAVLGYYSCCCGDTWASEVGIFSPSLPRLITTGATVRRGTNGAVSVLGLLFSAAGGLLIGMTGWLFAVAGHGAASVPSHVPWIIALGLFAGLVGSVLDSLLGATLQYSGFDERQGLVVGQPGPHVKHITGSNLLSNDLVNLCSASATALLTAAIAVKAFCVV